MGCSCWEAKQERWERDAENRASPNGSGERLVHHRRECSEVRSGRLKEKERQKNSIQLHDKEGTRNTEKPSVKMSRVLCK